MHKKIKILIPLFIIFIISIFFQNTYAKYVIEDINVVAKINIDRCKPKIELTYITTSNTDYSTYANKTHLITGHLKITEKNIIKNNLSKDNIKVAVCNNNSIDSNSYINPEFKSFYLISETADEKTYEFSFTNSTGNGNLAIIIPQGIVTDRSGLTNSKSEFITDVIIDNTPPQATFKEVLLSNGISKAEFTLNEHIRPINGWNVSDFILSKDFSNPITYALPIVDFAQNSSEVLVDIKNATDISLEYATYDAHSSTNFVTCGQIPASKTISSDSICKTEFLLMRLAGNIDSNLLQGRVYVHTYWGEDSRAVCTVFEKYYYHGYNPTSNWWTIGADNQLPYGRKIYSQFGGAGVNIANHTSTTNYKPIPPDIAEQYLFGVSGIQFRLNDYSNFSIVYQSYVKGLGWLKASSDGEENFYQHDKPISSFRINLVPKTEKQYLIDYWNRDVGTNNIH